MSNQYLDLRVTGLVQETPDAITLHLEHPDKKHITYKPGQFLTLILPVNGKEERRSYSLCSTPHESPRLAVTVKRVESGLVSNYLLNHVKVGDTIKAMAPLGSFNLPNNTSGPRDVVLFGAGSGITPLMSILKQVLREEPQSKVTLLYGNRNEDSVIFKKELERLKADSSGRLRVEYIYSQPKSACEHKGRMNQSMVLRILEQLGLGKRPGGLKGLLGRLQLAKQPETLYLMCGPEGMMQEVRQALDILHVPSNRILKESFVSGKSVRRQESHGEVEAAEAGEVAAAQTVTIVYEGAEYSVAVAQGQTILEAALGQNIDLPYSCQAGLCTACRGKCLSGKVHLEEREGLSDAEIDEGYVLSCVGHPVTSDVVIEIG